MNKSKISLVLSLIVLSCYSSLYAQIPFSDRNVIMATGTRGASSVYASDQDGD